MGNVMVNGFAACVSFFRRRVSKKRRLEHSKQERCRRLEAFIRAIGDDLRALERASDFERHSLIYRVRLKQQHEVAQLYAELRIEPAEDSDAKGMRSNP